MSKQASLRARTSDAHAGSNTASRSDDNDGDDEEDERKERKRAREGGTMREDESIQEQTLELVANVEAAASAEKRVAAFASLQAHLEEQFSRNGAGQTLELVEADAVASAIKVMLKNANQSVSAAGLLYLPSYARLLVTSSPHHQLAHNIRALMHAALPLVLERLGDHKDKIKEGAKAAIAEMGSAAFSTGTGAAATAAAGASRAASSRLDGDSSPQAYFERMIRDHGLGAKSAKVKEQVRTFANSLGRFGSIC